MERATAPSKRFAIPTPEDWDFYGETITGLYINRKMSLPRLQEHMRREFSFSATTKMYKMRFSQWGLKKNMTATRIVDALEHSLISQSTRGEYFTDGGKRQEYFRRLSDEQRVKILDKILQQLSSIMTSEEGTSAVSIPTPLTPPSEILVPERSLRLVKAYIQGCSETNRWPRHDICGFQNEDTVPAWCSPIWTASVVLKEGKASKAKRMLQTFIKNSPAQLMREDPLIFPFVFKSMLYFALDRPDIAQWLVQALHHVSETLPWASSTHPLRLLFQGMAQLGPRGIALHTGSIMLAYIDMMHEILGEAYPIVQDVLSDTMNRLYQYNLMDPSEIASMGQRMVTAAKAQNHHKCREHLYLKMRLSDALLQAGDPHTARITAAEVISSENDHIRSQRMMPEMYNLISRIHEAEGRKGFAEESALRALIASVDTFGWSSDWRISSMVYYRDFLEREGKMEKAKEVMKEGETVMEGLCSLLEKSVISDTYF